MLSAGCLFEHIRYIPSFQRLCRVIHGPGLCILKNGPLHELDRAERVAAFDLRIGRIELLARNAEWCQDSVLSKPFVTNTPAWRLIIECSVQVIYPLWSQCYRNSYIVSLRNGKFFRISQILGKTIPILFGQNQTQGPAAKSPCLGLENLFWLCFDLGTHVDKQG